MHAYVVGSQSEGGGLVEALAGSRAQRHDARQLINAAVQSVPPHLLCHVPHLPRGPDEKTSRVI